MAFAQILPSPEQKYVQCFLEKDGIDSSLAWATFPSWEYYIWVICGTGFCNPCCVSLDLQIKHLSSDSVQQITGILFNILGYVQQIMMNKNDDILFYCSHDIILCGIGTEVNRTFSWVCFAGYSIIKIWQLIVLFMLLYLMNKYISLYIKLSFVYTL